MSSSSLHRISLDDIAVVIAAKNEEKNIRDCILSVLKSAKGKAEVWVIDDGSTDQTAAILKEFSSSIYIITGLGEGPSIARNVGIQSTSQPYIAFTDADGIVNEDWLEALASGLHDQETKFVGIGGSQKNFPNAKDWEAFHAAFLENVGFVSDYVHTGEQVHEVNHNPTCNVLYQRQTLMDEGGFDEQLWPCEDLDLDLRLKKKGHRFLFTPKAIIYHHRPDSFMGFMRMMKRYGFGHGQIVKKHGLSQKIHMLPVLSVIAGVGLIYFAAYSPFLFASVSLSFMTVSLLWFCLTFLDYSKFLLKKTMYGFYILPSVLFWNAGFFSGLIQKKRITIK